MFARLKLVMCLLNENKTEAYLLRVLIEVGRRAKTYPKRSVRMIPASRNAFQLVTKAIVSIKSTFWFQRHNNFNWNWCIHSEKRVILTSSKNRTDHSFDKHAAGVHFCCRFTQYQHPPNILWMFSFKKFILYNNNSSVQRIRNKWIFQITSCLLFQNEWIIWWICVWSLKQNSLYREISGIFFWKSVRIAFFSISLMLCVISSLKKSNGACNK